MILNDIRTELFKMQDMDYRDFNSKLIPTVDKESMIGIRTPDLNHLIVPTELVGTSFPSL